MRLIIAGLAIIGLFGLFGLAAFWTFVGVSVHLDADRASETKLRQLNTLCGGPRIKKIGIVA